MVELTPTISSKNSVSYTQITPIYSPNYQLIPMSTAKILNSPQSIHVENDDEAIPLPKIPQQDEKLPFPADKEDEHKQPSLEPKSSFYSTIKSKYRDLKPKISKRCSVEESKLKLFLGSFIIILMLANIIPMVLFGVYFFDKKDTALTSANGALSYIAFSLSADPILDIQAGPSCPQGFESLLLGIWPGTTNGCECSTYLRSGVCHKTGRGATEGSCTDISSINPISLYDWSSSSWCVLKAKPGSQYKKAANCAAGFKKCSSGICVLDTLDCPVTQVKMTAGVISTEKVIGEPPVIGFAVTPNNIPCFSDDHFASGPVAPYVLINENEYGCGKYGPDDQYSFALSQEKQEDIFKENDFPKMVYSLPSYAYYYQRTDSVLSYRRRMAVAEKDACLNMQTEILKRPSAVTKDLKRFLEGTLIASLCIHGIVLFLVAVLELPIETCSQKSFRKVLQGEDNSRAWMITYFVGTVVEYIDFLVMFAATVHFRAKMIGIKDYLIELNEAGCFIDPQAQAAVSSFQVVVDGVIGNFFKYSLSMFLIASVALFSCGYLLRKSR